jgi:hypothetical protein
MKRKFSAAALALGVWFGSGPLLAATPVTIELNKLETVESACRAYLVFRNATQSSFSAFRLDLVLFGKDGVISRRLAVEAAPLAPGRTSVKLFDIQGVGCGDISQVLLNDIVACKDASGDRTDCMGSVDLVSKTPAGFSK